MRHFKWILGLTVLLLLLAGCQSAPQETKVEYYRNTDNLERYVLENQQLRLTMDGKTSYFTLEDKRSGRVWSSVPQNAAEDTGADAVTRYMMQSTLVLTYTDKTGNSVPYDSFRYAIEGGTFAVTREEDSLWVDYMIGPNVRHFAVPQVLTVQEMEEWTGRMTPEDKGTVLKSYRKLDPSRMDEGKLADMLEKIPLLSQGTVYALSTATGGSALPDYQMERLETAFAAAGYTAGDGEGDQAAQKEQAESICYNVTLIYRLEEDGLVVEMPAERIVYPAELPVESVRVLPYFCAADGNAEGWLLVPDGGGAQIFFDNGKTTQNTFYTNVYGWDEAISREKLTQNPAAAFPVFGIVRDGGYLMAVGEGGAAELSIEADVGGKRSSYSFVRPVFTVVHGEDTSVSAKSNATVRVFQSNHPDEKMCIRYIVGNSGSYVDMAERYRAYLTAAYPWLDRNGETGYPLLTELVGALDRTEKMLGIPSRKTVAATDYAEAAEILKQLSGIPNLRVQYSAVLNGGLDQTAATKTEPVRLGSKAQREEMLLAAGDAVTYLSAYAQQVFRTAPFDGFSPLADGIRDTTNSVVKRYPYDVVTLKAAESGENQILLLDREAAAKAMSVTAEAGKALGFDGAAFNDVGGLLYSDFNRKAPVSRDGMLRSQQKSLALLREGNTPLLVEGGNVYAAVYADCVSNMDLLGGGYDLIDRWIPFYQIALHGYVTYTGPALNNSPDETTLLLRSVEYGAGLHLRFMEFDYAKLQFSKYTVYDRLTGANFSQWKDRLTALYARLDGELGHTAGQAITGHRYITEQVTVTEYEDGTRVYVNYGTEPYADGSRTVPSRDWLVEKGG